MRILKDLISRETDNEQNLKDNVRRTYALISHISKYMLCLAYLGEHDPNLKKKQMIFKKFISSNHKKQGKYFLKLLRYKAEEDEIIIKALMQIEIDKADLKNITGSSLYKPFTWGVLTYEFQSAD